MNTPSPVPGIPGLLFIKETLQEDQRAELLRNIDQQPWSTSLRRRVQQYGYMYDYTHKVIQPQYLGPLPAWLDPLLQALPQARWNQCIINEYCVGQGIGQHTDNRRFGPIVASYTVEGQCNMILRPYWSSDWLPKNVHPFQENETYIFSGSARSEWTHEIIPVAHRRVSITLRTME